MTDATTADAPKPTKRRKVSLMQRITVEEREHAASSVPDRCAE